MLTFTLTVSFDHLQFALIHGPDIPGSYAILLFTASDLASITSHTHTGYCFCFGSIPSFFLELFPHWSLVAYWAPTDLGSSCFSILSFSLFILFMGFSSKKQNRGLPCSQVYDFVEIVGWQNRQIHYQISDKGNIKCKGLSCWKKGKSRSGEGKSWRASEGGTQYGLGMLWWGA